VCGKTLGRVRVRGERLIKLGYSWFSAKPIKVGPFESRLKGVKSQGWTPGTGNCLPVLSYLRILLTVRTSQNFGAKVVVQKGNSPELQLRTTKKANGDHKEDLSRRYPGGGLGSSHPIMKA